MTDYTRLIETEGFPLEEASEASAGDSSGGNKTSLRSLHRYPARRPLAACRAAIISTLLRDPGNKEERLSLRKMVGKLLQRETGNTKELIQSRELLQQGMDEPWRILDPFAGGGSIPFEAMRLGCQVESSDLNPVAWFVQKATMYYPSKIGLDELPLPEIIKNDPECFAAAGGNTTGSTLKSWGVGDEKKSSILPDHVPAWVLGLTRDVMRFFFLNTTYPKTLFLLHIFGAGPICVQVAKVKSPYLMTIYFNEISEAQLQCFCLLLIKQKKM